MTTLESSRGDVGVTDFAQTAAKGLDVTEGRKALPVPITWGKPWSVRLGVMMSRVGMRPAIIWSMLSPQDRVLTCEVRASEIGLVLRIAYGEELVWGQYFWGPAAWADIQMRAEAWRTALVEKGFTLDREPKPE